MTDLIRKITRAAAAGVLLAGTMLFVSQAVAQDAEELGETGTDPRDFAPKFMPYYRFTELENGLENHNLNLFGLFAFDKTFAMTYEIPIGYKTDISDTALGDACSSGVIPPGPGMPPIGDAEGDCE